MSKCWIAVASADHVRRGISSGFMQVCHGKASPLRRIQPGDRVVYYSPSTEFRGSDRLQSFTAYGVVQTAEPYQVEMEGGFCPFRRDVQWSDSAPASILPLLDQLEFTKGRANWGFALRFGIVSITEHDMEIIRIAMGIPA